MSDNSTTSFPKMGESLLGNIVNVSGQKSAYTKPAQKKGFSKGSDNTPGTGTKSNRGRNLIKNANGPRCYIQEKICYPNSGEQTKTQRNVKRVQGPYSFELARAAAGSSYSKGV